mgnify:CR=1 FL=1
MVSLSDLKKNKQSRLEKLVKQAKNVSGKKFTKEEDSRFWYPAVDKAGNGRAIIRFLPAPKVDGEDGTAFVRYFSHAFQGPTGKWYINNSLTTLGLPDPVSEYNNYLWNEVGTEDAKEQARKQKRSTNFVSNILVIKDPANPENEGKVFLYRYGPKIWSKIEAQLSPDEGLGEAPCDVFDFWDGKNFRLVIKNVAGYRNYDDSVFLDSTPISDDEQEIERIWEQEYSLQEFLDPANFKSYEQLKQELNRVLDVGVVSDLKAAPAQKAKPVVEDEGVIDAKSNAPKKAIDAAVADDFDDDFDLEKILEDIE